MKPDEIMRLRKAQGLTQEKFGEQVGASQSIVSQWELGTSRPNAKQLYAMENGVIPATYKVEGRFVYITHATSLKEAETNAFSEIPKERLAIILTNTMQVEE